MKNKLFHPLKRPYSDILKSAASDLKTDSSGKNVEGFPKYMGSAHIKGYSIRSFNVAYLKKGDELYLKREKKVLIDDKKKKKTKPITSKNFNDNIIRILTRTQEVTIILHDSLILIEIR